MSDSQSLSRTEWNCKYHIVVVLKFRKQAIYLKLKDSTGKIFRQLCDRKKVTIIKATACVDHILMLVSIPPNLSVSAFMGYLNGKSLLMIFDSHAILKYK